MLALEWTASQWVLLDANQRRVAFLTQVAEELDLRPRIEVVAERAETAGRGPLRGQFDLVVARSFGPPAVTAECASGFLRVGGRALVSEPPEPVEDRWDLEGLAALGLADGGQRAGVRLLDQIAPTPDRFPRRVGVPTKRPLWVSRST